MASLIYNLIAFFQKPFSRFAVRHFSGSRYPKIRHQILEKDFISQYKEIFVIGDVHGCFNELKELLDIAVVRDDSVLKIFVGDLVNKGPYNKEVLTFIRNSSSVLSVRGNHDEIVIDNFFAMKEEILNDKSSWIKELSEADIDFLIELPYTISIPSLNIIIVHAGLVPGIPLERQDILDMVVMRNLIITNEYFEDEGIKAFKYDTDGEAWASLWPGPQHVFFGHDAKRKLQLERYATGLDTGCVYGGSLTGTFVSGPRNGTFVQVQAKEAYKMVGAKKSKL